MTSACARGMEACKDCPLYEEGVHVAPAGSRFASVLAVRDYPTEEAATKQNAFSDGGGRILAPAMRSVGLSPGDVLNTYVVSCRPPSGRKPTVEEIEHCAVVLNDTMMNSQARAILAVGRTVLERYVGKVFVSTVTGPGGRKACWDQYVYEWGDEITGTAELGMKYGRYGPVMTKGKNKGMRKLVSVPASCDVPRPPKARGVVACLDPYMVAKGWNDLPLLGSAIFRAKQLADGEPVYGGPKFYYSDPELFHQHFLQVKDDISAVAFDIENVISTGQITDISFATSDGLCGSFPWDDRTRTLTQYILGPGNNWSLVAHNITHDVLHLEDDGVFVDRDRVECTMMMAYLDEPDMRKALGHVLPRYLLGKPWKHKVEVDMGLYNVTDSDTTFLLRGELKTELTDKDMWPLFRDAVMPSTMLLGDMTRRGLMVDPKRMFEWRDVLETQVKELTDVWNEETGAVLGVAVNPNSGKQLATLLFSADGLGLRPMGRTKTGLPRTDKETLLKVDKRHGVPLVGALLDLRKQSKLLSTYVDKLAIGIDGCVHPRYLPEGKDEGDFGAASGRLSSRNPNIQNQPHVARYMYVPHRPGRVIWARDYSQIEAVLVAILSGDLDLLAAYQRGEDRHQATADFLCERFRRDVPRGEAKGYRHGINYCMGEDVLAAHAGIAVRDARAVIQAFRDLEPKVFTWQTNVGNQAATQGYIANPFGRRRNFPGFAEVLRKQKHTRNAAVNFQPQSIVADIMLYVMPGLDTALLDLRPGERCRETDPTWRSDTSAGSFLLTQVHDECAGECDLDLVEATMEISKGHMERVFDVVHPGWSCPTTFIVGPNWAAAKDYESKAKGTDSTPYDLWVADGRPCWEG